MALHLVTGYNGSPHITSADQGMFNAGCMGAGNYVLNIGKMFEAQIISNNEIRLFDGSLLMQGRNVNIQQGAFENVTILNGEQSLNRHDLIVVRYEKNVLSGVENASLQVIQGVSLAGSVADPEWIQGNILNGDTMCDMPLYRVRLEGLSIVGIDRLFEAKKQPTIRYGTEAPDDSIGADGDIYIQIVE